jgi:alkylhydroperoxidase family enzyme
MGHQEIKLAVAGLSEDRIAALDGDWAQFSPAEQAAFQFARRLTFEPHLHCDADLDALRPHYTDLQILEMAFSIAANNGTNRWKEAIGVPQEAEASRFLARSGGAPRGDRPLPIKSFLTPTSSAYASRPSALAPVRPLGEEGLPARVAAKRRPPLESHDQVEQALAAARARAPRLPLVDEAQARALLPADWPSGPLPQWVLVLANFPRDGRGRILSIRQAEEQGDLSPVLKAQVSWIAARQDRAWYALGRARRQLADLGASDDEVFALDGDWSQFSPAEQAAFGFAKKLAATMDLISDADVAHLREHLGDRDTVQLIQFLTTRAFFNRVTEAAGLRLED